MCGGSQLFKAVNCFSILGGWMRMLPSQIILNYGVVHPFRMKVNPDERLMPIGNR